MGWDHHEQSSHHPSQVDYSKGFGGKFGLQTDRVDSSSVGWNDVNQTESHPSQMKGTCVSVWYKLDLFTSCVDPLIFIDRICNGVSTFSC